MEDGLDVHHIRGREFRRHDVTSDPNGSKGAGPDDSYRRFPFGCSSEGAPLAGRVRPRSSEGHPLSLWSRSLGLSPPPNPSVAPYLRGRTQPLHTESAAPTRFERSALERCL